MSPNPLPIQMDIPTGRVQLGGDRSLNENVNNNVSSNEANLGNEPTMTQNPLSIQIDNPTSGVQLVGDWSSSPSPNLNNVPMKNVSDSVQVPTSDIIFHKQPQVNTTNLSCMDTICSSHALPNSPIDTTSDNELIALLDHNAYIGFSKYNNHLSSMIEQTPKSVKLDPTSSNLSHCAKIDTLRLDWIKSHPKGSILSFYTMEELSSP